MIALTIQLMMDKVLSSSVWFITPIGMASKSFLLVIFTLISSRIVASHSGCWFWGRTIVGSRSIGDSLCVNHTHRIIDVIGQIGPYTCFLGPKFSEVVACKHSLAILGAIGRTFRWVPPCRIWCHPWECLHISVLRAEACGLGLYESPGLSA